MKKMLVLLCFVCLGFSAALPVMAESSYGLLYKNATEPGSGSSNAGSYKKGTATCTSYFALVAVGECGIKDAMNNGKIRSLAFYDTYTRNIIGYKRVTVEAYGY